MKTIRTMLCLLFALAAQHARADYPLSIHPSPVFPGQPAFVRLDESDGCFEFDQQTTQRNRSTVTLKVVASDFVVSPCPPRHTTPVLFPLGTFEAGLYTVEVFICGNIPGDPCGAPTLLTLDVGAMPRRTTIPAFGWIALLLSCSGILALAFTSRGGVTRR